MTQPQDRRAFLRTLAAGAAYAAPVIASVAAPAELMGQGRSSQHMHVGMGAVAPPAQGPNQPSPTSPPPWEQRPTPDRP